MFLDKISFVLIMLVVFCLNNSAIAQDGSKQKDITVSPGSPQNSIKKNDIVVLHLNVTQTEVCAGEAIEFTAKLENVSNNPVSINRRYLWRYTTEFAFTVDPASVINIPKARVGSGDGWEVDDDYVILKPNEVFKATRITDTSTDEFYMSPGRYTLETGYGQFRRFKLPGSKAFTGRVNSNTVTFSIKDCGAQ